MDESTVRNSIRDHFEASTDDIVVGALGRRLNETLVTEGGAFQTAIYGVSRDFFRLFGARIAHGRGFDPGEYEPGPPRAVVLSHLPVRLAAARRPTRDVGRGTTSPRPGSTTS